MINEYKKGKFIEIIDKRIEAFFRLENKFRYIHGSKQYCLENIAFLIGICDFRISSEKIDDLWNYAIDIFKKQEDVMTSDFYMALIANCMIFCNKNIRKDDSLFISYLDKRITRIYDASTQREQLFYSDKEKNNLKRIPEIWKEQKVLKEKFVSPYFIIPQIYDLLGFSILYSNPYFTERIKGIITYVFSDFYQDMVKQGYGISKSSGLTKSPYFGVGWEISIHNITLNKQLLLMILISSIDMKIDWYEKNLSHYNTFKDEKGKILFPKEFFLSSNTYWSNGMYNYHLLFSSYEEISLYLFDKYFN